MTLINSHYVHVEDIPRIPRCHKNLAGLPQGGSDKVGQSSRAAIFADSAGQNAYILSLILLATYFLVEVEFVSLNELYR